MVCIIVQAVVPRVLISSLGIDATSVAAWTGVSVSGSEQESTAVALLQQVHFEEAWNSSKSLPGKLYVLSIFV